MIPLTSVTQDLLFVTSQYNWYIRMVLRVRECFIRGQICHFFILHLVLPSRAIKFSFSTNSHSKAWDICGIIFNISHTLSFKPQNPLMQLFPSSFYRQGNRQRVCAQSHICRFEDSNAVLFPQLRSFCSCGAWPACVRIIWVVYFKSRFLGEGYSRPTEVEPLGSRA